MKYENTVKHIFDTRTKTIYLLNNVLWFGRTNDKKYLKICYNNGSSAEIWADDRTTELIEKLSSDNKEKKVKMTRQERISAAKTKLAQYEDAHKKYLEAQIELTEAYRSYDVGEHVHVGDSQTYGPSGPGQIVEILSDKKIKVKLDDGQIVEADLYELKRA